MIILCTADFNWYVPPVHQGDIQRAVDASAPGDAGGRAHAGHSASEVVHMERPPDSPAHRPALVFLKAYFFGLSCVVLTAVHVSVEYMLYGVVTTGCSPLLRGAPRQ